jgi:glycosyltransferase involved in cell wall biosynthesis
MNGPMTKPIGQRLPSILQVHSRYGDSSPSGENIAVDREWQMLREGGCTGHRMVFRNQDFYDPSKRLHAIRDVFWRSSNFEDEIRKLCREHAIDVVHVHNLFPRPGASLLRAIHEIGLPIVMTVHNFRLGCANGLHLRHGAVCTLCQTSKFAFNAVRFGCYQGSRSRSLLASILLSGLRRDAIELVDKFIVLTDFHREYLASLGIKDSRISTKANVVHRTIQSGVLPDRRAGYLYVGRLSAEKGILQLMKSWAAAGLTARLSIAGDGPLRNEVERLCEQNPHTKYLGVITPGQVAETLRQSIAAIVPSRWFEGFPNVIAESMCESTPVLVNDCGALPGIVRATGSGEVFTVDDPMSLRMSIETMDSLSEWRRYSESATKYAVESLHPRQNLERLLGIYGDV